MMGHEEAVELILAFAEGSLGEGLALQVAEHVAACEDCRGWLETYTLFSTAEHGNRHVQSELLATYAADRVRLKDEERSTIRLHLNTCRKCRLEFDLVTSALERARRQESVIAPRRFLNRFEDHRMLAVAAVLVVSLLAVTAVTILRGGSPWLETGPTTAMSENAEEGTPARVATAVFFSTRVEQGAELCVHARSSVVFGDGFSVATGGSLIVGTDDPVPQIRD